MDFGRGLGDEGAALDLAELAERDIEPRADESTPRYLSAHNQRVDRRGGALENRARLVREVTREVRARTRAGGGTFTVGVRLSPEDFGNAKGMDRDESV